MANKEKYLLRILISKIIDDDHDDSLGELGPYTVEINRKSEFWPTKIKYKSYEIARDLETFLRREANILENISTNNTNTYDDQEIIVHVISDEHHHQDNIDTTSKTQKESQRFIVRQSVLEHTREHADTDLDHEVGGFLLGKHYEDAKGHSVSLVTGMARAKGAIERGSTLCITPESQKLFWELVDHDPIYSSESEWCWIGHYHTHPRYDIFYSCEDKESFRSFFPQLYHVGMVIDPVRNKKGFFGWNVGKDSVIEKPSTDIEYIDDKDLEAILAEISGKHDVEMPEVELFYPDEKNRRLQGPTQKNGARKKKPRPTLGPK